MFTNRPAKTTRPRFTGDGDTQTELQTLDMSSGIPADVYQIRDRVQTKLLQESESDVKLTHVPGPTYPPPLPPPRGQPGIGRQYDRTYVLLPPPADAAWVQAVIEATWEARQYTLGGSADDAGIGDLNVRRVIAVNPAQWGNPPLSQAWYDTNYPGAQFIGVNAATPQELQQKLAGM